jgi:hypothetical protein
MYSAASYAAYMDAVGAGRAVLANLRATQSEIIAAYHAILTAKANLSADKNALRAELNATPSLDTVDTSRFTEKILEEYNFALTRAKTVLADSTATQPEVNEALENLQYAKGYIFVDYSALEAEVAKAAEIEAKKDLYAPFYYKDYMFSIHEAQTYYLGEDAYPFHQTHVDAMTNMLKSGRYNLVTYCTVAKLTKDIVKQIDRYYNEDLPAFKNGVYSIETWMFYSSLVKGAELLILGDYSYSQIEERVELIDEYRGMLMPEVMFSGGRHSIINNASFQLSSAKSGAVVRMQVDTIRSYDSVAILVIDENGFMVANKGVTIAPYNRRKPQQKLFYVDVILDLEPGEHTYTVYASDPTSNNFFVLYCGDPVECTITVG